MMVTSAKLKAKVAGARVVVVAAVETLKAVNLAEELAVVVVMMMEVERLAVAAEDRKAMKVSNGTGMVEERGRGGSSKGNGGGGGGLPDGGGGVSDVVEVGVLRMAGEADAHDMNGKMRKI